MIQVVGSEILAENVLSQKVIGIAIDVHKALGPGLLETYLKLGNFKLGLLMNFNVVLLKNGIKRITNGI